MSLFRFWFANYQQNVVSTPERGLHHVLPPKRSNYVDFYIQQTVSPAALCFLSQNDQCSIVTFASQLIVGFKQ